MQPGKKKLQEEFLTNINKISRRRCVTRRWFTKYINIYREKFSFKLTGYAEDHDGVGPEGGPVRERRADGPVALGRDGDHHEDGAADGEPLERVQQVGEGHAVPHGLGHAHRPDEGPHHAVVHQVIEQQEGVDQRCSGRS